MALLWVMSFVFLSLFHMVSWVNAAILNLCFLRYFAAVYGVLNFSAFNCISATPRSLVDGCSHGFTGVISDRSR